MFEARGAAFNIARRATDSSTVRDASPQYHHSRSPSELSWSRRPRSPPEGPPTTVRQLTERGRLLLERRLSSQRVRRAVRGHGRAHRQPQRAGDRLLRRHQQELRGRHQLRQDPQQRAHFAPGQSTSTFNVTINDQGINGPMRTARAYLYGAHPQPLGTPSQATIDLLQNDPLGVKDPENPLGYPQAPTDGDPLQYVNWYVFGTQSPAGDALGQVRAHQPRLGAGAAHDRLLAGFRHLSLLDVEPACARRSPRPSRSTWPTPRPRSRTRRSR